MEEGQAAPEPPSSTARNRTSTRDRAPGETHSSKLVPLEHRGAPPCTTRTRYRTLDWPRQRLPSRATLARGSAQSCARTRRRLQALESLIESFMERLSQVFMRRVLSDRTNYLWRFQRPGWIWPWG